MIWSNFYDIIKCFIFPMSNGKRVCSSPDNMILMLKDTDSFPLTCKVSEIPYLCVYIKTYMNLFAQELQMILTMRVTVR